MNLMRDETRADTVSRYRPGRPWKRLPECVKAKVLERYHDLNTDHDWHEGVYGQAIEILDVLGYTQITIEYRGFWSQGDGAAFAGKWHPSGCEPTEAKSRVHEGDPWRPYIDRFAVMMVTAKFDGRPLPSFTITTKRGLHTEFEFEWDDDEYHDDHEKELKALSRDLMDQIYEDLRNEYEYLSSDAQIVESIEANDYHFNFEGDII